MIFAQTRLHNKTTRSRPGWGQNLETKAEAKASRPKPKFWPRGHFGLEDLTSLTQPCKTAIMDKPHQCGLSMIAH